MMAAGSGMRRLFTGTFMVVLTLLSVLAVVPAASGQVFLYEVDLSGPSTPYNVAPGATIGLNLSLTNFGSTTDTFLLTESEAPTDWNVYFESRRVLLSNQNATIPVTIEVPADSDAGRYVMKITATSQGSQAVIVKNDTMNIVVQVTNTFSVTAPDTLLLDPGINSSFDIEVWNLASGQRWFNFTGPGAATGWDFELTVPGGIPLSLSPGQRKNVTVRVRPDLTLPHGTQTTIPVTAIGSNGEMITTSVQATVDQVFDLFAFPSELVIGSTVGGTLLFDVTVNNTGQWRGNYTITPTGIWKEWVTNTTPAILSIAQGAIGTFQVTGQTPANASTGNHTLSFLVASLEDETVSHIVSLAVDVDPSPTATMYYDPGTLTLDAGGSQAVDVVLENTGNIPITCLLTAQPKVGWELTGNDTSVSLPLDGTPVVVPIIVTSPSTALATIHEVKLNITIIEAIGVPTPSGSPTTVLTLPVTIREERGVDISSPSSIDLWPDSKGVVDITVTNLANNPVPTNVTVSVSSPATSITFGLDNTSSPNMTSALSMGDILGVRVNMDVSDTTSWGTYTATISVNYGDEPDIAHTMDISMVVHPWYDVDIAIAPSSNPVSEATDAQGMAEFGVVVTNTGNYTDTFLPSIGLPAGWGAELTTTSGSTVDNVTLASDASITLTLTVSLPGSLRAATYPIQLRMTSTGDYVDPAASDVISLSVPVLESYGYQLTTTDLSISTSAGVLAVFDIHQTHQGLVPVNYSLVLDLPEGVQFDTGLIAASSTSTTHMSLLQQSTLGQIDYFVLVTARNGTPAGSYPIELTVTPTEDPDSRSKVLEFTLVIEPVTSLSITPLTPRMDGDVGGSVDIPIQVSSLGNRDEDLTISVDGLLPGWTVEFLPNAIIPLPYTMGQTPTNNITLRVQLPDDAVLAHMGDVNLTVNARAISDPTISAAAPVTISVGRDRQFLVLARETETPGGVPTGSVAFRIEVVNTGNQADTYSFSTVPSTDTSFVTVPNDVMLGSGDRTTVTFEVNLSLLPIITPGPIQITVEVVDTGGNNEQFTQGIQVQPYIDIDHHLELPSSVGLSIDELSFQLIIENNGNVETPVNYTIIPPSLWKLRDDLGNVFVYADRSWSGSFVVLPGTSVERTIAITELPEVTSRDYMFRVKVMTPEGENSISTDVPLVFPSPSILISTLHPDPPVSGRETEVVLEVLSGDTAIGPFYVSLTVDDVEVARRTVGDRLPANNRVPYTLGHTFDIESTFQEDVRIGANLVYETGLEGRVINISADEIQVEVKGTISIEYLQAMVEAEQDPLLIGFGSGIGLWFLMGFLRWRRRRKKIRRARLREEEEEERSILEQEQGMERQDNVKTAAKAVPTATAATGQQRSERPVAEPEDMGEEEDVSEQGPPIEEEVHDVVGDSSSGEPTVLRCINCEKVLIVRTDQRPIRLKCPRCDTKMMLREG